MERSFSGGPGGGAVGGFMILDTFGFEEGKGSGNLTMDET